MSKPEHLDKGTSHSFRANLKDSLRELADPAYAMRIYMQEIMRNPERKEEIVHWMQTVSDLPRGLMLHMSRRENEVKIMQNGLGWKNDQSRTYKPLWWRTVGGPEDAPLRTSLKEYARAGNPQTLPDAKEEYIASLGMWGKLEARVRRYNAMDSTAFQNLLLSKMIKRIFDSIVTYAGTGLGNKEGRDVLTVFTDIAEQEGGISTYIRDNRESLVTQEGNVWIKPSQVLILGHQNGLKEVFAMEMCKALFNTPLPITNTAHHK